MIKHIKKQRKKQVSENEIVENIRIELKTIHFFIIRFINDNGTARMYVKIYFVRALRVTGFVYTYNIINAFHAWVDCDVMMG